eukprot:s2443_g2.t1
MLKLTENFAIVVDTLIQAPQGPVAVRADSHLLTDLVKDGGTVDPMFSCPQDLAPFGIKGNFDLLSHALLNVLNFQSTINKRGHPVDYNGEFYRRNPCAHANTFTETPCAAFAQCSLCGSTPCDRCRSSTIIQALKDPSTRDDAPAQPDPDTLADAIVRQFATRHFKPELNDSAFSENNISLIRANITCAAITKGYALRLEGADTDKHQRDVIFSFKSHVKAKVEELLHNTPGYEDIVTDQEEFDANQNLWTQQVEDLVDSGKIPEESAERYEALSGADMSELQETGL